MAKKAQTASFMVRFTQKIYDENGESKVQWRGNVSHVQGGEDINFTDFNKAVAFIQEHLAQLTMDATEDRSSEEQENILSKSFSLFKSVAATGPKIIKETLKDPRKQVASIQDQLTEYSGELLEKVPIDQWRNASKSDFKSIQDTLDKLTRSVTDLSKKMDAFQSEAVTDKAGIKKTTARAKTNPKKA
ncbi:hypothetical protein ABV409_02300 [Flagellimonas sp. DF-77]|uniref:hypothetical protein n=1 Tax=Flagellimonas algarum TaxID=3230298 RepID=UPI0033958766